MRHSVIDFFAGSGLVSCGLSAHFDIVWANDICPKKAKYYVANHGTRHFHLGTIEDVDGEVLPTCTLAWASFPCVDLSLAGNRAGLNAKRSGLYWEWLRVVDEMKISPQILVIENVEGLYSSNGGADYRVLHQSLVTRGYNVGPMIIDAKHWVPQSRVRAFIVAVKEAIDISSLTSPTPSWVHSKSVLSALNGLKDTVFWRLPEPPIRQINFMDLVDHAAPVDPEVKRDINLRMIPDRHLQALRQYTQFAAPGYKRTRQGSQVLELRFDGLAGCLRVPRGGNSRQYVVIKNEGRISTRLLTSKETVRLMGAPENFATPGSYNETYAAMGDAVAFPVVKFLADTLLSRLAELSETNATRHHSPVSRQIAAEA